MWDPWAGGRGWGLMWGTVSHDNEQYATLALYLRLKGLVPPSSEK